MTILDLCAWLESTSLGTAIRESPVLFPWIESVHVLAVTFVFGAISIVDLRLLGFTSRSRAITRMSDELLPWVWGAFALAVVSGLLLFSSIATRYYVNTPFRIKAAFMVGAGLNMLMFHFVTYRGVRQWDLAARPPTPARIAGGLSIVCWGAVIVAGRWIGFTLG